MRTTATLATLLIALAPLATPARVTRVEITSSTPAENNTEAVRGVFYGEVDPGDPRNAVITDIKHAPRNARGMVEYSASLLLYRPTDPAKASGVMLYDVPNRGNGFARPGAEGHVLVMSGWQGDIDEAPGVQWAKVPVARGLTGGAMARFDSVQGSPRSIPIVAGFGRMSARPLPVSLDTRKARLMVERNGQKAMFLKPGDWAFADCRELPFPGKPDGTQLCLKNGFDPDAAYTLGYTGKDPLVLGLGFAMTRDLITYLRSGKPDDAGHPNPAGTGVRWTIGAGQSQSGNYLRTFLNLGFNRGEDGTRIFDGLNPNIAARQLSMNIRFAVPGSGARLWEPGSEGTLWWGRYTDKTRGLGTTSLLDQCTKTRTCPKIVETFGSAEFWGLRGSPMMVGTDAKTDIPLPATVRRYYSPGVTHGGSFKGGFPAGGEPVPPGCALAGNPNPSRETVRVALAALIDWVKSGKEPPASRYPTLASGDLVEPKAEAMGWPAIPGVPKPDASLYQFHDYDFGRGYDARRATGVTDTQPPRLRRILPARVPRVNADGNESSGVPSTQHMVPLGTYTGWNVLSKGYGAGGNCVFFGGFIPFARTKAERDGKGDPRLSLEERYTDHGGFVSAIRKAVAAQQASGWLMRDDADRLIKEAEASDVLR